MERGYWVKCICCDDGEFIVGKKYWVNEEQKIRSEDGFYYAPAGCKDAVEWLHQNSDYKFVPCNSFNTLLEV